MIADATNDRRARFEWPTLALAAAIYGGWALLTWFHALLPLWVLVPLGGWVAAWHSSLQHETIHGHPSANGRVNAIIGGLPLSLWLPYRHYRREHIEHHAADIITDPVGDPESFYLAAVPAGGLAGVLHRSVAVVQAPLIGRLVLGPLLIVLGFLIGEVRRLVRTPGEVARDWLPHITGLTLVGGWLAACHFSLGLYIIAFIYPGAALSLLRSFAEHRAAEVRGHRVAVVEKAGPFALLFLNNNLHAAHHRAPGVAWFRLPGYYLARREEILLENGGLLYRGYGEVARRFALRAHDTLVHPLHGVTPDAA